VKNGRGIVMKKDIENKLLAVVRIRGRVGTRRDINETLSRLGLKSPNNLVVVYGTKSILGMISKCNDFVTYGEVDRKGFELIAKKTKATFDEETFKSVSEGKKNVKDIIKMPVRMNPPRKGYESTKKGYSEGGASGYRGEKINELIGRMAR
jgi:large subunit ribosomal protein L30